MNRELITFFITFNPIVIGLLVTIFYTHISDLRRDLFSIKKQIRKKSDNEIKNIIEYCYITDIWLVSALLFWIVGTYVGSVTFANLMGINILGLCPQQLMTIGFLVNLFFHCLCIAIPIAKHFDFPWRKSWRPKYKFNNRQIISSKWGIFFLVISFFLPFIFQVYLICKAMNLNSSFETIFVYMIFISVAYLLIWALLGVCFAPLTSLEKLRKMPIIS